MSKFPSHLNTSELKKKFTPVLNFKNPVFSSGDTIVISEKIYEGKKTRIQKYQGVVLKRTAKGVDESVLLRKESNGIWLEKLFLINSPTIVNIEVLRWGKVRRAFISYMRQRSGKQARIKENKNKY